MGGFWETAGQAKPWGVRHFCRPDKSVKGAQPPPPGSAMAPSLQARGLGPLHSPVPGTPLPGPTFGESKQGETLPVFFHGFWGSEGPNPKTPWHGVNALHFLGGVWGVCGKPGDKQNHGTFGTFADRGLPGLHFWSSGAFPALHVWSSGPSRLSGRSRPFIFSLPGFPGLHFLVPGAFPALMFWSTGFSGLHFWSAGPFPAIPIWSTGLARPSFLKSCLNIFESSSPF